MNAIEIDKLSHYYQIGVWRKHMVRALDSLSIHVAKGEVFGFLGPNGAGKTTTFKILMRLIKPTSGVARILGRPLDDMQMRGRIGYMPEQPYFYDYLTAREFLTYAGSLCDLTFRETRMRTKDLLYQVGLTDAADKPLRKFSKGMLQRIGLAQALINDPTVLFLDEPMSGLDPLGRREVRDLIASLRTRGKTIFFSSHILTDVEAMCDRVAILDRGRLVEYGKLSEILRSRTTEIEAVVSGVTEEGLSDWWEHGIRYFPTPEGARVRLKSDREIAWLMDIVHKAGGRLVSINPVRESLEEIFVREVTSNSHETEQGSYNPD
jgi:ABC-2 type transport system ATP-binding protein